MTGDSLLTEGNGVITFLALTGDRLRPEDNAKGGKGVFDLTSVELVALARSQNQGLTFKQTGIRCVYIIPIGRYEIIPEIPC